MLAFATPASSGLVREGDEKFASLLQGVIERNATLRRYFQPQVFKKDLSKNWLPITSECQFSDQCHCGHVSGESADASDNPSPTDCENAKSYGKLQNHRRHHVAIIIIVYILASADAIVCSGGVRVMW